MLGSVFDIGDVFGSAFDFGDMFGSAIDVNKPTVCLPIHFGDVFESVVNLMTCLRARLILVKC
jgi:hypothetical protein